MVRLLCQVGWHAIDHGQKLLSFCQLKVTQYTSLSFQKFETYTYKSSKKALCIWDNLGNNP